MSSRKREFSVDLSRARSLRDIAVESLREAIVGGVFPPGTHLKERELSEMTGVSTTPIKEAFRILGAEGLVTTVPRKGTFVSQFVNSSIEEVLTVRAYVEGLCCRLAVSKITNDQIEALNQQIGVMEGFLSEGDTARLESANERFHETIREAAENPLISKILVDIASFDKAFRKRALKASIEAQQGFKEHKSIFEAVQRRDADRAEAMMIQHILRTAKSVLKEPGNGVSKRLQSDGYLGVT